MNNEKIPNNIPEVDASKFVLVNKDINAKIHDQKFETRPTTFARDAFKRFCKNKSSVVGAIIIGVLLMGSFLSFLSPYDIRTAQSYAQLLPAKLFDAGTGWWDGCLEYKDIPYDGLNDEPIGFKGSRCYNIKVSEVQYLNQYYRYGDGGYLRVTCKNYYKSGNVDDYKWYLRSNDPFVATPTNDLTIKINFDATDNIDEDQLCDSYQVLLRNGKQSTSPTYVIRDWSNEWGEVTINASEALAANYPSVASLDNCQLMIYARPKMSETAYSYFLIENITLTSNNPDEEENLKTISFNDANKVAGLQKDSLGQFPAGYWASSGVMNVYRCQYKKVSFRYDKYDEVFGDQEGFKIGDTIMQEYIAKGWCEFPDYHNIYSFKVLDANKCPVKSVSDATYYNKSNTWEFTTTTTIYKYKGFKTMPRYLFGTDALGHDLMTVALSSLKTSLLVAIISSAVCLIVGLIWGSISGYFGGNVDIIMERITDILGGVPWIVMMTLIILLLGNNIVTFGIALVMTGWIGTATRTRAQFYRFKRREYILASRTLGASDARLIFRHILPNGLGTIVTGSVLMIPGCIFSEASISYLGLGLQGVDSFGVLLSDNQHYLSTRPLLVIIPAIIISLLMISFNLFGNGLRDALNPTLKGGE